MSAVTLEQLAARVETLEQRLARLEGASASPATEPPPVYAPPPAWRYKPINLDRPVTAEEEDAEYFLGAKVLPRVGAAVLVLGIGYLVSMAISRGLLGPWSIFGLAVVVCLGLIGLGQHKRDEREQFGEVLTGTGVSGLYVTFAAGHAYQNLYSGEMLVAQFLGLSLASLFYSLWRKSPAFLGIGILGGFAAAAMPLRNDAFVVTSVLHAAVLGVATAVASRNRWAGALLSVAVSGFLVALGLAYGKEAGVPYGVGLIYLSAWALIVGWHRVRMEDEGPIASSACVAVCLFVAAGFAYGAFDGIAGTRHVLGFATLAAALIGGLYRPSESRNYLWSAIVLAAIVYAPVGLPTVASVLAYPTIALAAALVARRLGIYAVALGAVAFAGGVLRYVAMHFVATPGWLENAYLGVAAVSAVSLGLASRSRDGETLGWAGALAALGRFGFVYLVSTVRMDMNEAVTALMIGISFLALILGFARKLSGLRYLSFAGLAATVAKVLLVDLAATDPVVRVTILMVLGLVLIGGGYVYIWQRRSQERSRSV